jgi:cysteine desulfurase
MGTVGAPRIYLDHNATSPLRDEARRAFEDELARGAGNPSSLHAEGRAARARIEAAREAVAALVQAQASEIVFTSGGTEAISAAVRGVTDRAPDALRRIVVSAVEHSAVLEAAQLAARRGFLVVRVPVDADGRVDVEAFRTQIGDGVALAALQWANPETGVVQPVEEIGRACRERGVPFLVDAVQAAGKTALDARRVSADLIALSAHKIGGPQGAGALVVRSGIALVPLLAGGAQERRRRGGTENVAAIVAFGAAARAALHAMKEEARRLLLLRARIETRLLDACPGVRFHGQGAPRLATTTSFALEGVPGETLVIAADLAGIALSTGSACASGAVEPSHVLVAMGASTDQAKGAVRVSLGWSTTAEEVERFLEIFPALVAQVREGLASC